MNCLSDGTFHFRRELRPFDIRQRPFRGGVKIQFRLPKEHGLQLLQGNILVVAEQPGYFGYTEVPSRAFHCINEQNWEYELNAYMKTTTELRLAVYKKKPGVGNNNVVKSPSKVNITTTKQQNSIGGGGGGNIIGATVVTPVSNIGVGGHQIQSSDNFPIDNDSNSPNGTNPFSPISSKNTTNQNPSSTTISDINDLGNGNSPKRKSMIGVSSSNQQQQGTDPRSPYQHQQGSDPRMNSSNADQHQVTTLQNRANGGGTNSIGSNIGDSGTTNNVGGSMNTLEDDLYAPPALEPKELQSSQCTRIGEPSDLFLAYPLERPLVPRIRRWWGFLNKISVSWDLEDGSSEQVAKIEDYQGKNIHTKIFFKKKFLYLN